MKSMIYRVLTCCFFGGMLLSSWNAISKQPEMLPHYTGTILPTPQEATYMDEFLPLTRVGLVPGADVKASSSIINLLKERIVAVGGEADIFMEGTKGYSCILELRKGDAGLPPGVSMPQKDEGYLILPAKRDGIDGLVLAGHDATGLLWAVVSAGQLMRNNGGKAEMRCAKVRDFPVVKRRGFKPAIWDGTTARDWAWYGLQFKFNVFVFNYVTSNPKTKMFFLTGETWREEWPASWTNDLQALGSLLSDFGMEWYVGCSPIRGQAKSGRGMKVRSGNPDDIEALVKIAEAMAQVGGNMFLLYDDTRFPLSPADNEQFGTAREADVYLLNHLYKAVRQKYPSFKLLFCPPFYWGPECDPFYTLQGYTESREHYLIALGSRVPEDIGIFWTGPRVWGREITKADITWITSLIQRKPWMWQNGTDSPHPYLYHYATDPVRCWKDWHYAGFFDDVETYIMDGYNEADVTLSDYLWNPSAYDAERSVREMNMKVLGCDAWQPLENLNRQLSKFDIYYARITPGAIQRKAEIEKEMADLEAAWNACLADGRKEAIEKWTMLPRFVSMQKTFVGQLAATKPSYFDEKYGAIRALAQKETDYKPETDVLLTAYDWFGGIPARNYEHRIATWIYGSNVVWHEMTANFTITNAVMQGQSYRMMLCGQDGDSFKPCRIAIILNGNELFAGENPLPKFSWNCHEFQIPAGCIKAGQNVITIQNIEPGGLLMSPPWFMLNYAIISASPVAEQKENHNKSSPPSSAKPATTKKGGSQ
jgi:hypothetical protein